MLLGRDAERLGAALGSDVPQVRVNSLDEAVFQSSELAQPSDAVLLSPACASLDMFSNFEERGRLFAQAVGGLK
jgi:UDP-N-acetylmuramoylalanine--D-glutamate ligase